MIRVLLNTATITGGGGMQVTINFIQESQSNPNGIEWYYVLSKRVVSCVKLNNIIIPHERVLMVSERPAKIRYRKKISNQVLFFEKEKQIDIVYSLGSPSYIRFCSLEAQRLTNPYIVNPNKYAYKTFPFFLRLIRYLKTYMQRYEIRNCKYFISQTILAKENIIRRFNLSEKTVFVVPNAVAECFMKNEYDKLEQNNIFCLAGPYPHKNIQKIPHLAFMLKERMQCEDFRFIITIEKKHPIYINLITAAKRLNVENLIINVEEITQEDCVQIYSQSKVVFLPTYLEIFSATLIESMKMGIPVVTTDFDFNRIVAKDSAFYFAPGKWEDAVDGLYKMLTDEDFRLSYIEKGNKLSKEFLTSKGAYYMTCKVLKEITTDQLKKREIKN
jgi:glycosyltransferase involved in cell wall biosynthesis